MVDGELIGDPLDVKMFEFTGWSFEEGSHNATDMEVERDYVSPSIARPPADFAPDYNEHESNVSMYFEIFCSSANDLYNRVNHSNLAFFDHSNLSPNFVGQVLLLDSSGTPVPSFS